MVKNGVIAGKHESSLGRAAWKPVDEHGWREALPHIVEAIMQAEQGGTLSGTGNPRWFTADTSKWNARNGDEVRLFLQVVYSRDALTGKCSLACNETFLEEKWSWPSVGQPPTLERVMPVCIFRLRMNRLGSLFGRDSSQFTVLGDKVALEKVDLGGEE